MNIEILARQNRFTKSETLSESIISRICNLRRVAIRDCFRDFSSQAHRLETVARIREVDYIDDSMANNINATWFALENINKPITWIVGEVNNEVDYNKLYDIVKARVKNIIYIGSGEKLLETFYTMGKALVEVDSLAHAVEVAYTISKEGGVVLYSPATPYFGSYEGFENRGLRYKKAVNDL